MDMNEGTDCVQGSSDFEHLNGKDRQPNTVCSVGSEGSGREGHSTVHESPDGRLISR